MTLITVSGISDGKEAKTLCLSLSLHCFECLLPVAAVQFLIYQRLEASALGFPENIHEPIQNWVNGKFQQLHLLNPTSASSC